MKYLWPCKYFSYFYTISKYLFSCIKIVFNFHLLVQWIWWLKSKPKVASKKLFYNFRFSKKKLYIFLKNIFLTENKGCTKITIYFVVLGIYLNSFYKITKTYKLCRNCYNWLKYLNFFLFSIWTVLRFI